MGKIRKSQLQKKEKTISKLPRVIRKKSLKGKKVKKGIKQSLVPKTNKKSQEPDLDVDLNGDDFNDADADLSDEDAQLIEKTRAGESFPINTKPMDSSDDDDDKNGGDGPKMDLDHLIENDPDFYQYLLKNEKSLLEFEDDEEDDGDDQDDDNEEEPTQEVRVTDKLLQSWSAQLKSKPERTLIRSVIALFKRAVDQVSGKVDESDIESKYKISSEHFNSIMKLCFIDLTPALFKSVGLDPPMAKSDESMETVSKSKKQKKGSKSSDVDPSKCSNWKKMVGPIKSYLSSVLSVLNSITNESVTCSILRHCLHLIPFISCYNHLVKRFLNKITTLWSSERSEKIRILSFLFILRILKRDDQRDIVHKSKKGDKKKGVDTGTSCNQLDMVLRKMYLSFVKNCRLTNVETWPFINFMRQSLIELYSLDQGMCYKQTFVFLRQTAINLRNAMTNNSAEGHKTVLNWPFIHTLCLWTQLLTTLHPSPVLKPLIYPLVQVIMGTINLAPSNQVIPVKFHLIRSLIQLSKETDIFIPIAHLIVETLDLIDYSHNSSGAKKSKKQKIISSKVKLDLMSVIKVSKGDANEVNYREEVIKTIFTLMLEYLSSQSHRISFPEITFVTSFKLKKFNKDKCKSSNDSKLMKQLIDKIEENNNFILNRRKVVDFKFSDLDAVNKWENEIKQESNQLCPIAVFYSKWKAIRVTKERNDIQERKRVIQEKKSKKGKKDSLDEDGIESDEGENGQIEDEMDNDDGEGEDAEVIYDDDDSD